MLIHLGNNEFIDFNETEMIINLDTTDEVTTKNILASIPSYQRQSARSAILSTKGEWIASTLTAEVLAQRSLCNPFKAGCFINSQSSGHNSKRRIVE